MFEYKLDATQLQIMTAVRDLMVKNRKHPVPDMPSFICTNIKRVVAGADNAKLDAEAKKLVGDLQNAVMAALGPSMTYASWRVANDKQIAVRKKAKDFDAQQYVDLMRDGRITWLDQIVGRGSIMAPVLV